MDMDIKVLTSIPSTDDLRDYFIIGTHNKMFHVDDVVAVATFCLIYKKVIIVRSRDPEVLNKCKVIVDIGGGRFDHHISGFNTKRENGITFASAGLVWREFGIDVVHKILYEEDNLWTLPQELCSDIVEKIDKEIIQYVDAEDNGIELGSHPLSFISSYLPAWYDSSPNFDIQFYKVLEITINVLKQKIQEVIAQVYADTVINKRVKEEEYLSNHILEIPCQVFPWLKPICAFNQNTSNRIYFIFSRLFKRFNRYTSNGIYFIIFPYPAGGWAAQCVPPSFNKKFKQIIPFPKAWAGQSDNLAKISGIDEAILCANGRFFARATTKKGIIKMCKTAMYK